MPDCLPPTPPWHAGAPAVSWEARRVWRDFMWLAIERVGQLHESRALVREMEEAERLGIISAERLAEARAQLAGEIARVRALARVMPEARQWLECEVNEKGQHR